MTSSRVQNLLAISSDKAATALDHLLNDYQEDNSADMFNALRSFVIDGSLSPLELAGQWFDADPEADPQWAEEALIDLSDACDLVKRLDREELTTLCLRFSLCPLHRIDYAICFDDEDPACMAIRLIHPNHDT